MAEHAAGLPDKTDPVAVLYGRRADSTSDTNMNGNGSIRSVQSQAGENQSVEEVSANAESSLSSGLEQVSSSRAVSSQSSIDQAALFSPFSEQDNHNTHLEHVAKMSLHQNTIKRMTSIICTIGPNNLSGVCNVQLLNVCIFFRIGPKTNTPESLLDLRRCGMNICRMNFSHGSYEYHRSVIDNLHKSYIM